MSKNRFLKIFLYVSLFLILVFFEFFYLFGFVGGTCYAFCMTFYNISCYVFSVGMFLFGLASLVAWFPKYTRISMAFLSTYFGVTLLDSLCWTRWAPLLSFTALLSSVLALGLSDWRVPTFGDAVERLSFGLAISAFVFLAGWDVMFCLDSSSRLLPCALVALGLLSAPLRIKRSRYSPLPLLAYFTLSGFATGFDGLELFGLVASSLAFLAFIRGGNET